MEEPRFVMNESLLVFGVGKRDCVVRQSAMKEIRYTLAYLLMFFLIRQFPLKLSKSKLFGLACVKYIVPVYRLSF